MELRNSVSYLEVKGDWDFRVFDLVKKTLIELIFNPFGQFP